MPVDKFPPIFYFAAKALPKKDVAVGLLAREKKASAHVLARWEAPSFYDTFRSVRS